MQDKNDYAFWISVIALVVSIAGLALKVIEAGR